MILEPVLDPDATLGEGPVWLDAAAQLVFVDIIGRRLHRYDPALKRHDAHALPEDIGCVVPHKDGGFVAALRSGIWRLSEAGEPTEQLAANPEDTATSRFNDGRTDPAGRLVVGTIDEGRGQGAALYRFDRRGLHRLFGGIGTSNGLAFSPDGRWMYHADTGSFAVRRFAYDPASGEIGAPEIFVQLDDAAVDRGRPDGAAVDSEGCYWTALWDGARVQRYDPDGRLMAEFPTPALRPTMPCFGGPGLRTLFVPSARDDTGPDGAPLSGAGGQLFAMPAPTAGIPSPRFDPAA
jgi:sugar lactone lactonase YvrE